MAASPQVTQLTIREMADFAASLLQSLGRMPDAEKLRPAVEESLSAECVQCAIRLTGPEVLKFGAGESDGDQKIDRLRSGYCARNGCDSHYYRVTCAPHPLLDWPKILAPAQEISNAEAEAEKARAKFARTERRYKNFFRTATIIGALVLVYIFRQIYFGGTIPFIREPENFKVDRLPADHPANLGR